MIITLIIMKIIMAMAMDMTKEPDTRSAGMLQKLFSNIIVFIFFLLNYDKQKTSPQLITAERFDFYFLYRFSQQQQPAVPQPIIMVAIIIITLLMLLKNCFILSSFDSETPYNIPFFFTFSRRQNKKIINFSIFSLSCRLSCAILSERKLKV